MKRILPLLLMVSLGLASQNTFKIACLNVDGLPQTIAGISLNSDGPGSSGTTALSQKLATMGYDVFSVSEDFNFNDELMSSLSAQYNCGTYRGGIETSNYQANISYDTDGLNLLWKKSGFAAGDENIVGWTSKNGKFQDGADELIDKGFRSYTLTVHDSVQIDVYIVHMDAECTDADLAARESNWSQIVAAILASNNKHPVIVMGDTNSRYTRDRIKQLFVDVLEADSRFSVQDAWVEFEYDSIYPIYPSASLMVGDLGYMKGEVVDKILYVNNNQAPYYLSARSYLQDTTFVKDDGTALADHWPIVVEFEYYKKQVATVGTGVNPAEVKWQGENPTQGGEYYIYHPNTKTFLSYSGTSLTPATTPSFTWTMTQKSNSDGVYTMTMYNGAYYFNLAKKSGSLTTATPALSNTEQTTQVAMSGTSTQWPAYKIYRTATPKRYLNYGSDGYTGAQNTSVQNDWVFISKQQYRDSVTTQTYVDPVVPAHNGNPAEQTTAIEIASAQAKGAGVQKFFRNGRFLILKDGKEYDATGAKMR